MDFDAEVKRDLHDDEVSELRAEVIRLREALTSISARQPDLHTREYDHTDYPCYGCVHMINAARAALEVTP